MCARTLIYSAMFLLWLAAPAPFAAADTYFVAPHGDDSHAGTESQPWKTLRKAAAAVQPGDTVRIKAGDYFVGPTWIVNRAGTAESPITYRAFGDGEVRITGSSLLPPEKWTHVKGGIYSTPIDQPVMAVFQNAYPLHSPGDRAKIFSVDDMIPKWTHRLGPGWQSDLQQRLLRRGKAGRDQPELDRQLGLPQHVRGLRVCRRIPPGQGGEPCAEQHRPGCREVLPRLAGQGSASDARQQPLLQPTAAPRWERDGVAYPTFAGYQQAADETHSRYADPKLAGPADAHLQPGSPAIEAGARQKEVTVDIEGFARPQGAACDIGAYEFKVN